MDFLIGHGAVVPVIDDHVVHYILDIRSKQKCMKSMYVCLAVYAKWPCKADEAIFQRV